ncbi:nucleotide exchange factor GrpE [Ornithinibacillus bavariensis]|uniref:nucleotide exchange factor GrpE n=1 Tax=Ornithinibacillus bavariensis TaxID=545502 RepID=UPI000EE3CC47|nr:nucleotide exchange factor GrpE [Ornithinibacillus sp.]
MEEENLTEEKQIDEEEATDTSDAPVEESPEEEMNDLVQEIENLKQEKEELYQRFLRTQAEFDNFKKRSQKEKEADRKYKAQDLVTELLPAIDNFERALQVEVTDENKNLLDGISMVYRQLVDALKSQGVEIIEAVGKEFDPNIHQAVMQVEDDNFESNIVVEDLQKGYLIKDRVIRPAMVKVNK